MKEVFECMECSELVEIKNGECRCKVCNTSWTFQTSSYNGLNSVTFYCYSCDYLNTVTNDGKLCSDCGDVYFTLRHTVFSEFKLSAWYIEC